MLALVKFVIMMHDACAFQSLHCLLRCRGCLSQPPEDGSLESRNIAVKGGVVMQKSLHIVCFFLSLLIAVNFEVV